MPNFSDIFPTLRIDPKDVSGSWKRFLEKFNVAVRFEVCNRGMKKVVINDVEQDVNVFDDELKLCALLKAVSNEGFEVLHAQGIDIHSEELNYDQVLQALKNAYAREESLNVKLWNFNSARQQSGEDSRDFLRRVEHLSRTTGIFQASTTGLDDGQNTAVNNELERIRQTMAQVVVVNGLKDLQLRLELMAMHDLNWEKLCRILSSRSSAAESEVKLDLPVQVPNSSCNLQNCRNAELQKKISIQTFCYQECYWANSFNWENNSKLESLHPLIFFLETVNLVFIG